MVGGTEDESSQFPKRVVLDLRRLGGRVFLLVGVWYLVVGARKDFAAFQSGSGH